MEEEGVVMMINRNGGALDELQAVSNGLGVERVGSAERRGPHAVVVAGEAAVMITAAIIIRRHKPSLATTLNAIELIVLVVDVVVWCVIGSVTA